MTHQASDRVQSADLGFAASQMWVGVPGLALPHDMVDVAGLQFWLPRQTLRPLQANRHTCGVGDGGQLEVGIGHLDEVMVDGHLLHHHLHQGLVAIQSGQLGLQAGRLREGKRTTQVKWTS